VLRFWELKFPQLKPMKRGGGRRLYRPVDVELLKAIRDLLQTAGYTIKGVQKLLRERGIEHIKLALDDRSRLVQATSARRAKTGTTGPLQLSAVEVGALHSIMAELAACHALLARSRSDRPLE
jgi:DNA-binding transcriptional MerR regulator